ncbi:unnamed protein product [Microthlaspi erraticum]|uniref:Retrotransposon gag domain-containing protein n=1 Tax=Microthlaspi erraticum TaxID=1685480 RepID=A0A6D2IUW7_9BRAS|nr:unnamed protein product [Microthlaspi erraticum]
MTDNASLAAQLALIMEHMNNFTVEVKNLAAETRALKEESQALKEESRSQKTSIDALTAAHGQPRKQNVVKFTTADLSDVEIMHQTKGQKVVTSPEAGATSHTPAVSQLLHGGEAKIREEPTSPFSGGPWPQGPVGKERGTRHADGRGDWRLTQIGNTIYDHQQASSHGDFRVTEERTRKKGYDTHRERGLSPESRGFSTAKMEFPPYDATGKLSWVEFKRICKSRFGKADSVNPVGELSNLRHTGTVNEYCKQFEICLGRQTRLTGEQQLWQFCAGLTDSLRKEVQYLRPETIFAAMEYARDNEYKIDNDKRTRTFGGHLAQPTKTFGGGFNRGQDARPRISGQKQKPSLVWKKLTAAEIAERKAKGLCFNCDDSYTPGHTCNPVLFHVRLVSEGENQDDEPYEEEELEISLNAMNGEQNEKTFQVRAVISTGEGWVLLDTGSTHNFIKSSMVERLDLHMIKRSGRFVTLPDGGRCPIDGLCPGLAMNVQGHQITADCFAIPSNHG